MGFFDFLSNLGQKAKDTTQNIPGVDQVGQTINDVGSSVSDAAQNLPGADIASQIGQNVSDTVAGVADGAQNVASQASEHLTNLTDKLPKP